jgi:coenzyme F420-reducing hydrogenase beta subunit
MNYLAPSKACTGCLACAVACPKSAIVLTRDSLGNVYPKVDESVCVACGLCGNACPIQNPPEFEPSKAAFAAWSLDAESRATSASGGAAAEFYSSALAMGYWICGAKYEERCRVVHTLSRSSDAIRGYKQSKYVFSDAAVVFREIKRLLDQNEKVLIISLPCKIAGLLRYLQKSYENLLTVDIVCHGTPSAELLQGHLREKVNISDGFFLSFRKDNQFALCVEANGKTLYRKVGKEDTYLAAFLDGLSYRESCYQCRFAQPNRVSDITICDYWGIGEEIPFDHPYTGSISAVLVNTEKGRHFFQQSKHLMFIEARPVSEVIHGNAQLNAPTPVHPMRDAFLSGCEQAGFEYTVSRLLKKEIRLARRENIKYTVRSRIRRIAGIFMKRYRG